MMNSCLLLTALLLPSICYLVSGKESGKPLYLTPLIESEKLQDAKKFSRVDSKQFKCKTESYSGFLTVDKDFNSNLFFWFFKSKDPDAPVLLWLQGGPGATSMRGLFDIIGPFQIKNKEEVKCREHSWTKAFSVLFIDSPVGTGFSFTEDDNGYAKTLQDVTNDLYNGLTQFFTLFEEQRKNEFYMAGQSYAGKYVPSLAYKIHNESEDVINFKGIAVGNGFIDPVSSLAFGPFLYQLGLIDDNQKDLFDEKEKEIQSLISKNRLREAFHKWDVLIAKMMYQGDTIFENATGYSHYYDVRLTTSPLDESLMKSFLKKTRIRKALHVGDRPFVYGGDNNEPVLMPIHGDILRSVKPIMAELMENYKVLIYNGNMDAMLSGVIGNQFLKKLEWKHREEYLNAKRDIWKVDQSDSEVAGYIKRVHKFREVVVRNAGHSVPSDQPESAYDMITKFVRDEL